MDSPKKKATRFASPILLLPIISTISLLSSPSLPQRIKRPPLPRPRRLQPLPQRILHHLTPRNFLRFHPTSRGRYPCNPESMHHPILSDKLQARPDDLIVGAIDGHEIGPPI